PDYPRPPTSAVSLIISHTAPTDLYTLSLHDALPIWYTNCRGTTRRPRFKDSRRAVSTSIPMASFGLSSRADTSPVSTGASAKARSEEHTSELQSRENVVCRLLLEKKKNQYST